MLIGYMGTSSESGGQTTNLQNNCKSLTFHEIVSIAVSNRHIFPEFLKANL